MAQQHHHGHQHDHGDKKHIDWAGESDRLQKTAKDDAGWYADVAAVLWRPTDELAVDFACGGAGLAAALAAHSAGHGGRTRVVGLDRERAMFDAVADDLTGVEFTTGSFEDDADTLRESIGGSPDLIWARNAVHHADDGQNAVDTLAELLRPGGRLVLGEGGLPARFLPYDLGFGRPGLEDGLSAATHLRYTEIAHHVRMAYGWPVALKRAGLVDVTSRTLLIDHPAPLTGDDLTRALDILGRQVGYNREHIDAEDLAVWDRLLDPADEQWLGRRQDVYHLDARTIHIGHKRS